MDKIFRRAEKLFESRRQWEALWQMAYEYMAPERAFFHLPAHDKSRGDTGEFVFDSTAIDAAERLVNLVLSGLIPPWMPWFRIVPGRAIVNPDQKTALAPLLAYAEKLMQSLLLESNFYQEMQPMLLDRVVGGTGAIALNFGDSAISFKSIPLAEIALEEDNSGEISAVVRKYYLSFRDMDKLWKLPEEFRLQHEQNLDEVKHEIYTLVFREPTGMWESYTFLKQQKIILDHMLTTHPPLLATRWTRLPGTPYGRGPGLRALADVRALNKLKELSLLNAAKAVSGIYTAVDDGVLNPYTLSLDPGAIIPVASNSPNERSLDVLPSATDFNIAMWSFEELKSSIKMMFMADQFGPLEKTPRSATEVLERTRIVAQELGATIARLQYEILMPILRAVFNWLGEKDMLPPELSIDGANINVDFVSALAQAQWAQQEQNILQFMTNMVQFGQVDPKAGLLIDIHAAGRKLAEIKGIPLEILRTPEEIEQLIQEAAQNMGALNAGPTEAGIGQAGA